MTTKLQQIIEAHLPKEREIIKPYYSEVNGYQEQYNKQVKDNQSNFGFNSCLAEIKKALPDIELAIKEEIRKVLEQEETENLEAVEYANMGFELKPTIRYVFLSLIKKLTK